MPIMLRKLNLFLIQQNWQQWNILTSFKCQNGESLRISYFDILTREKRETSKWNADTGAAAADKYSWPKPEQYSIPHRADMYAKKGYGIYERERSLEEVFTFIQLYLVLGEYIFPDDFLISMIPINS